MIDTYPRFREMRLRGHHSAVAEPNPQIITRGTHPINGPVLIADPQDDGASSGAWRLPVGTDDLAVSGVPCQGGAYKDGTRGDDTAVAELWREQHPEGHE
jgi:hypothetical protein